MTKALIDEIEQLAAGIELCECVRTIEAQIHTLLNLSAWVNGRW